MTTKENLISKLQLILSPNLGNASFLKKILKPGRLVKRLDFKLPSSFQGLAILY